VVITGGSAHIKRIAELAKDRLELPSRIAKPTIFGGIIDTTHDPLFATAAGLMLLDMAFASPQRRNGQVEKALNLSNNFIQTLFTKLRSK
jgi:cell division protein FtsA